MKYSIGNGIAKELICMIHGHELRLAGGNERYWVEGAEEGKTGTTVII